jgi:hypothetical protein
MPFEDKPPNSNTTGRIFPQLINSNTIKYTVVRGLKTRSSKPQHGLPRKRFSKHHVTDGYRDDIGNATTEIVVGSGVLYEVASHKARLYNEGQLP